MDVPFVGGAVAGAKDVNGGTVDELDGAGESGGVVGLSVLFVVCAATLYSQDSKIKSCVFIC